MINFLLNLLDKIVKLLCIIYKIIIKRIPIKKSRVKNKRSEGFILAVLSIVISGIVGLSGLYIYYKSKEDIKHNLCIQEIRNFDTKFFVSIDLSVLLKECKQEVFNYGLLTEVLYSNKNNSQKLFEFTSIINDLYLDGLITSQDIINFTHNRLMKKIENSKYKYTYYSYEKKALPEIKKEIEVFLYFTSKIDFKQYTSEQLNDYYTIFSILIFKHDLLKSKHISSFSHLGISTNDLKITDDIISRSDNFLLFDDLFRKIRENKKTYSFSSESLDYKNDLLHSHRVLFNSYLNRNNKKELINLYIYLVNRLDSFKGNEHIYKIYTLNIITLIYHELDTSYILNEEEQFQVFSPYIKNITLINDPLYNNKFITDALFYELFEDSFKLLNSKFLELLFTNIDADFFYLFDADFLNYIAIKGNHDLLFEIFHKYNKEKIRDKIFNAILLSYTFNNGYYFEDNISKKIINIIEKIKDNSSKKYYLRNSLILNQNEIDEYTIRFISKNKNMFLADLNDINMPINYYELYSIFPSLLRDNNDIFDNSELRESKVNLILEILKDVNDKKNKVKLYKSLFNFIDTNFEIRLLNKIKNSINKENDLKVKRVLLKNFENALSKL